jgi:two-component system, NtrC family, sensor kinase
MIVLPGPASDFDTVVPLMKIRAKVFTLLAAVFFVLAVVEWAVGQMVLLPRFEEIERDDALTAMTRIEHGIEQQLTELQVSSTDWGNWTDTYRFAEDRNATFAEANLTTIAVKELRVTVLAIVDASGGVIWSHAMDPATGAPLALDLVAGRSLPADFPWRRNLTTARPARGLIATSHGVLLAAVAPILDGYGHGPSHGMVLMGRLLTAAALTEIGAKAQTEVAITTAAGAGARLGGALLAGPWGGAGDHVVADEATTQVYRTFQDIQGHPAMTLRVDVPRKISARARATVTYTTAFTVGVAIVVLILLVVVLNRTVLNPLDRVTRHAVAVGKGDDLTTRLGLGRRDEIGELADELDSMVAQLAESRREHIDHSFQAGMAEFSRGVLHNVGNAMTPLCVRLAKLEGQLRGAPTADVERALAERDGPGGDAGRRADIDEFLRLASAELARTVAAAAADAGVASRQAAVVQTALAEQLRSSKGAAVVEPVDLPSVIGQSLEIVPDGCRERLAVEVDESVRALGVLRLARTVLRLVLQNVIINAAEAVRAAGRDRGVLRVRAALDQSTGRDELVLQCEDSGVGISAENLGRIFERDFSTKRAHGNIGIGLHWCATAVGALGGRIWATSDGVGRGTTIHLVMPVVVAGSSLTAESA